MGGDSFRFPVCSFAIQNVENSTANLNLLKNESELHTFLSSRLGEISMSTGHGSELACLSLVSTGLSLQAGG